MLDRMFYTKIHHIPVFKVIIRDEGQEPLMDFMNPRTKVHEQMTVPEFHAELDRFVFCKCPSLMEGS